MVLFAIISGCSTTVLHFIITAQDISLESSHCGKTEATTGIYGIVIRSLAASLVTNCEHLKTEI